MPTHPSPPPLGIVGGSAFLEEPEFGELPFTAIGTARGPVPLRRGDGFAFLRRHGEETYHPPHRIPHHAHVLAFESLGIRDVIGIASTGSLREELRPGTIVIPDDYLSAHPPPTFAGDEYLHIVPEFDAGLRGVLVATARQILGEGAGAAGVVDGGVYAETAGPRFETRAEVRALARDAHLVGMTVASEATLFQERGIRYAALCVVDNHAHGIGGGPLSLEAFQVRQAENGRLVRRLLRELIEAWRVRSA